MRRWLTQIRETSRFEKAVRTLAALAIMAIEAVGVLVGRIGLFGLIGVVPLLLIVGGWRRRPRLALTAQDADANGVVWGPRQRWPVSAERVLLNERIRRTEQLEASEKLSKTLPMATHDFGSMPASDRAYGEARDAFLTEVDEYCENLGAWLSKYDNAAASDGTMFRLQFAIRNGENWTSHAEGVRLELALPAGVRRVTHAPTVSAPPEQPDYQQPPRQPGFSVLAGYAGRLADQRLPSLSAAPDLTGLLAPERASRRSAWSERDGGALVWAPVGDVYVGGSEEIGEQLILQLTEPEVIVRWRVFFKGGSSRGSLTLRRPEPRAAVPAFGRLAGPLSYPDVAIIDDDGEIVHSKRTSDPPLAAPVARDESSGELRDRLRASRAITEWDELGLDPNGDGAAVVVRVGKAEPTRPPVDDRHTERR